MERQGNQTGEGRHGHGETQVREFYETAPYPDLGVNPKNPDRWILPALELLGHDRVAGSLRYLDAGCGTGHVAVGVARKFPNWRSFGIDLSSASLSIANQLAAKHGAVVTFARGSYLDPLPFEGKFDLISAMGTIHHCDDPVGAVRNLLSALNEDGCIVIHLYGKDLDRGKFEIREILDIMQPDITDVPTRFRLYQDLKEKQKKRLLDAILDISPRLVLRACRDTFLRTKRKSRGESWSPSWREDYEAPTTPWIDHFCHPLERTYSVREVQKLADESELEVLQMLNQGKTDLDRLPPPWLEAYEKLDVWDQRRLMELLDITERSVLLIGHPARRP